MIPMDLGGRPASLRQTETRHHPKGLTCHHFAFHRLTCDEYDQLRDRAAGRCELCGTPELETGGKRLVVDHFWDAGIQVRFVRGLLCDKCNSVMACLDGNKPWGSTNRRLETRALDYEAHSFQRPTEAAMALVEEVRRTRIARREQMRSNGSRPRAAAPTAPARSTVRVPLNQPAEAAAAIRAKMTAEQWAEFVTAVAASAASDQAA